MTIFFKFFSCVQLINEFINYVKKKKRGLVINPPKTLSLSVDGAPKKIRTFKMVNGTTKSCDPVRLAPVEKIVGIDCEMVEANNKEDVLARIAIVTRDEVLYKDFVLACDIEDITNYNTEIT